MPSANMQSTSAYAASIIFGEVRRFFCLTGSCLCTSILCSANGHMPNVAGGFGSRYLLTRDVSEFDGCGRGQPANAR